MAEYLNGQNLNAYLEPVDDGIIAYLDFGSFNEQINICGVELVVCENDVVIKTHTVNCCPAPAPFVFFDIVEVVKMIFEKRV